MTIHYTFGDNLKRIKDNLGNSFDTLYQWFYENYMVLNVGENVIMVLNAGKCHLVCLENNTENETFLFNNILTGNSRE